MARGRKGRPKSGGLGKVADAASKQKGKAEWLKLDDGDVAVIRVLDTGKDFKDAYVHRVEMETDEGKTYYADVPCLDQDDTGTPCPGCKDDIDRRYKFWTNVIVRGDDGEADKLMIWSGGITIAKRLDKMDARYGIGERDIEVEREGKKMNDTKYEIEWADEEDTPLSDDDKALAEKKHDLNRYAKPPEFDDFYVPVRERNKDDDDVGDKSVKRGSAFKRRQKEDDDDAGERKTASRRRSSSKASKPAGLSGFGKSSSSSKKTTVRRRSR